MLNLPMPTPPEDPIERLARRTAEINDQKARERELDKLEAYRAKRNYPLWFVLLPIVLLIIALIGIYVGISAATH
jgi:C4-dicarboxylate transporter